MFAITAREQPMRGSRQPPIGPKDAQQLRRQHDVTVASAFALLDADNHAAAVDIGHLDAGSLGGAQARRIRCGQRGTGLEARHRLKEAHDLVGPQHHRQFARRAGIRDTLRQVGLLERDAIQEPKRAHGLVQRRPQYPASNEVNLEGADILQAKPLRRTAEETAEFGDGVNVGSLGCSLGC